MGAVGEINLDHRVVGVDQHRGRAVVSFAGGDTAIADIVIAADRVHSVVRETLFGATKTLSGLVAYRGIAPRDRVPDVAPIAAKWWGANDFLHEANSGLTTETVYRYDPWQVELPS